MGSRSVKYFGLYLDGKKLPLRYFDHILERVRKKLSGRKIKSLSFAGRITLLKSVLQTLPSYLFSSGWVPIGVLEKLERDFKHFIWGKDGIIHGMTMISWDKLRWIWSKIDVGISTRHPSK